MDSNNNTQAYALTQILLHWIVVAAVLRSCVGTAPG